MLCDVAQDGSLKGPNASQSVSPLSSPFHARERLLLSERRVFMSCSNAVDGADIHAVLWICESSQAVRVIIITNERFATGELSLPRKL